MKNIKLQSSVYILMVCVLGMFNSYGQKGEVEEVLKKIQSYYKTHNYDIGLKYNMHRGLKGHNLTETYNGRIYKDENVTVFTILNTEIITFPKSQITVDHNNREVKYLIGQEIKNGISKSPMDVSLLVKQYPKHQLLKEKDRWICEFVATKKQFGQGYGKIRIHLNKDKERIIKQEFYFSELIPFKTPTGDKKLDYGRLEIEFRNNDKIKAIGYKEQDFIRKTTKGVKAGERIANYSLIKQSKN